MADPPTIAKSCQIWARRSAPVLSCSYKAPYFVHHRYENYRSRIIERLTENLALCCPGQDVVQHGSCPFQLHSDASVGGFGAILNQRQFRGSVRPILYVSRATLPYGYNWNLLVLEGEVIIWAIKHSRQGLFRMPFETYAITHWALEQFAKVGEYSPLIQEIIFENVV